MLKMKVIRMFKYLKLLNLNDVHLALYMYCNKAHSLSCLDFELRFYYTSIFVMSVVKLKIAFAQSG